MLDFPSARDLESDPSPGGAVQEIELLIGLILIVDDNSMNRRVLKLQLANHGASVHAAENGLEALTILEQQTFDIVLMDCHMPVMDGYEASRQIRAYPEKYQSPVIIGLTASSSISSRERGLGAGMNEFLVKPIAHQELLTKLLAYRGTCWSSSRLP